MSNPINENVVPQAKTFLLVGERQGVAADEEVEFTDEDEEGIILATSYTDLADEEVDKFPLSYEAVAKKVKN